VGRGFEGANRGDYYTLQADGSLPDAAQYLTFPSSHQDRNFMIDQS
jgi:hypothetical protein